MTTRPHPPAPESGNSLPNPHSVRKRTRARELVLRALYLVDIRGVDVKDEVPAFFAAETEDPDVVRFALDLFEGCLRHRDDLDVKIAEIAENWQIHRMAVIDRNILRLGTYELTFVEDIPPKVSINEAIDLAKKYSTAESGAFVNGILDKLRSQLKRE